MTKRTLFIGFIQNLDTFTSISRVLCFSGKKKGLNSESRSNGSCTPYFNKVLERMDKLVGPNEHRCTEIVSLNLLDMWYQYNNESPRILNTEL